MRILIDCTANDATPGHYTRLLRAGVSVVTPNKRAFSGSSGRYHDLVSSSRSGCGLYFETTVGAGLPVLRTVADLVTSGDEIVRIEGVLSGTLAYLFDRIMAGDELSAAVREAHERGFTEPDPREDLGGADVQRKLVILARQAGFAIEPGDVHVEAVLPGQGWGEMTPEAFWEALPTADVELSARRERAMTRGHGLCFLATVDAMMHASASLKSRPITRAQACVARTSGRDHDTSLPESAGDPRGRCRAGGHGRRRIRRYSQSRGGVPLRPAAKPTGSETVGSRADAGPAPFARCGGAEE